MKLLSNILLLLFLLISFSSNALAGEKKSSKDYFIKLSADNHLKYSQNAASDLSLSAISGLAYWWMQVPNAS